MARCQKTKALDRSAMAPLPLKIFFILVSLHLLFVELGKNLQVTFLI